MLKIPVQTMPAAMGDDDLSVVGVEEKTHLDLSFTVVLAALKYVPHTLPGRAAVLPACPLLSSGKLSVLRNQFALSSASMLFDSEGQESQETSILWMYFVKPLQN